MLKGRGVKIEKKIIGGSFFPKMMILQGVGHRISYLWVCYMNDPQIGWYMVPAHVLDLTTSIQGGLGGWSAATVGTAAVGTEALAPSPLTGSLLGSKDGLWGLGLWPAPEGRERRHSFPPPSQPQQGDKLRGFGLWPALGGHAGAEHHNFPLLVKS